MSTYKVPEDAAGALQLGAELFEFTFAAGEHSPSSPSELAALEQLERAGAAELTDAAPDVFAPAQDEPAPKTRRRASAPAPTQED